MTNNVINCEYMDIYDNIFNLQNDSDSMIPMHLNIRSLQINYNDLHNFVASLSFRPGVICLSKSRINKPLKSIQLQQSYNFINAKPNKQAGGTAIYVCSELKFSQIDAFGLTGTESILLKIWNKDLTKALVIIASIYRGTRVRISTNSFVIFRTVWRNYLMKKKTFTFFLT